MTWLIESPWPALMMGVSLELCLAIYLVRSGRAVVIAAMVLVAALTGALLLAERWIVTDAEAVEDTLDAAATALEANNPPQVLALFASDSPRRREVESILSRVTVREARVGELTIQFDDSGGQRRATARFMGRVQAHDKRGQLPYEQMVGKFVVYLHREGDRWLIDNYSENSSRTPTPAGGGAIPQGP
jgi:hypothetical protein